MELGLGTRIRSRALGREPLYKSTSRTSSFFTRDTRSPATLLEEQETELSTLLEESPDTVTTEDFLIVLRALADSALPDAALRAERWMRRLEQTDHCKVTSECYQRVIEAWAEAFNEDPARIVVRAEGWLRKYRESAVHSVRPDTACFNAFLDVCTRGRSLKGSHDGNRRVREHAEMAEKMLRYMVAQRNKGGPKSRIVPNTESFNLVIRGWTRCRKDMDLADRAMAVYQLMERYRTIDAGVAPDPRTFGLIMDSIAVRAKLKVKHCRRDHERDDPLKNGMEEINSLRSLLEIIHEKHASGQSEVAPSTYTYNVLLACWSNVASLHENATDEAESIMRHMTSLQEDGHGNVGPDAVSYMSVMRAWLNSKKANRGQRIGWLLSKQWKDYEFSGDESIRPTVDNYNISIRTWCNIGNAEEAEVTIRSLMEHGDNLKIRSLQPNTESYVLVVKAWLRLAEKGSEVALKSAARWMDELLQREKEEAGVLSSVELYLSFFGAARHCALHFPSSVLQLTYAQFEKLKSSRHTLEPLHYARIVQIIITALSWKENNEMRRMALFKIIAECKEDGLVSGGLLRALVAAPVIQRRGWTIEESRYMVYECFPRFPFPVSWTRNVRQVNLLPKKQDFVRTSPTGKR